VGANACPIFFVPKSSNVFGYCVEEGQIKKLKMFSKLLFGWCKDKKKMNILRDA